MLMTDTSQNRNKSQDELVADLTVTAYQVALKHGIKGNFLECELEMHRALRKVLKKLLRPQRGNKRKS